MANMAKVMGIISEKGGVGKSTTATTLAYLMARRGQKVLLVDFDGQANASFAMGIEDPNALSCTISTLMQCAIEDKPFPEPSSYIFKAENGVDVLPSNRDLFVLERNLASVDFRERKLAEVISELKPLYEVILIDCMPQAGIPMINVLMTVDSILIPTQAELFSAQGLGELLRHHQILKKNAGRDVKIEGILITMDSGQTMVSAYMKEELQETYGGKIPIFETSIPRSIKVSEACLYHKSICEYLPDNPASLAYEKLLKELDDRATEKCT